MLITNKFSDKPTVSVVITTYNSMDCVGSAIKSVVSQTYPYFEIIVVDDGSSDDTVEAVNVFGDAVKYINQPHSGLPAVGRNNGINNSTGEYIAILDADDTWELDKLERQVSIARKRPRVGLICANAWHWENANQSDRLRPYLDRDRGRDQGRSGAVLGSLLRSNFVIASTAMFRKSLLDQVGFFCEAPELRAIEDYDLWLRLATISHIHYLKTPLATYCDFDVSLRDKRPYIEHLRGMIMILERLQADFPEALRGLEKISDSQLALFREQLTEEQRAVKEKDTNENLTHR